MKTTARFCLATAFVMLCAVLPTRADYSNTVASFNPLGYWRLSETVSPPAPNVVVNSGSLGAAADGWPYPGTLLTFAQPGVVGNAIAFTNTAAGFAYDTGSLVDIPPNAALNPDGAFTIEFWGKVNGHANDLVAPICSLDIATGTTPRSGYLVYHDAPNGRWQYRVGGTAGYSGTVNSPNGSVVAGNWYHVVGTYNGSQISLYVNGQLVATGSATGGAGYRPNRLYPLRLGATTFPNRGYDGALDEVAVYGTVLSANSISNHYFVATNNPAGYAAVVLADAPVGYWHMDEPVYVPPSQGALPVSANSGSLGSAADGTNQPGLTVISGPPFTGFEANNRAVQGRYSAGNVNLGNPPGLNFSGQLTILAWVKPSFTTGLRNIVSHGYRTVPDGEVQLRINGGNYDVGSWGPDQGNAGEGIASTGGRAALDAGNWVFLAGTFDGVNWNLYRYGTLIASGPGAVGAMVFDDAWSIGSRGDTSADGRFFGGAIDEVAIFDTALSAAQIQQIFLSAQMSPVILQAPVPPAGTVFEGSSLSFSVEAAGNPTLLYQWTKDGSPLPGQTGTTLALNNVTAANSGNYAIVVTNNYGSITSSFPVTIVAGPPAITVQPQSATRFAGGSATFNSGAVGSPTITYQWYYNTNTAIGGATGTSYTKGNIQTADAGTYNLRASNPNGSTNSAYANLTVLPQPTAPYPGTALADNPIGYWRLGETSGSVARDYWGGHDGTYNAVTLGQPGYSSFDPDTAARFTGQGTYVGGIGGIDFAGASSTFTVEAWVKGSANQVANAVIISKGRGPEGAGGVNGWQFVLDVTGGKYRFHVEPASGTAGDATADVGPNDTWQHVVGVYDGAGMSIYVNGAVSGGGGSAPANGPLNTALPVTIGGGQGGVTPVIDLYFNGTIDEVAIYNTALNDTQIQAHYCGRFGPGLSPVITAQPAPVTDWVGWPASLSVDAAGSCTLTYQWYKGVTPLADTATITGSQTPRLNISALSAADAGNYSVRISNSAGNTDSAVAVVTVLSAPTSDLPISGLVMHHKFDGNLVDATGRGNNGTAVGGPNFEAGQLGQAFHYTTDVGPPFVARYATLGVRPDLQFSNNVNFTIACWVKLPLNSTFGDLPYLCSANNSYGNKGLTFAPSYQLGGWSYWLGGSTADVGLYGPDNKLNDGVFHHLVHTFDRTGAAITYFDGVQLDTRGISNVGNVSNGKPLNIGQDPEGDYPETGEGWIDDLGVWRKALTALEVRGLYTAATNGFSFVGVPPTFTWEVLPGGSLKLTWDPGTLTQADNVTGPYTDVPGATSPYTVAMTADKRFYKLR